MYNWLITKHISGENASPNHLIELNHRYRLIHNLPEKDFLYDPDTRSGIFIKGNYTWRLHVAETDRTLQRLMQICKEKPEESPLYIKGIYTVILIENGNFKIFNDPLGLSMFFFAHDFSVVSHDISPVKSHAGNELSHNNILEYYVFNYCLNGNTFFRNISCSTPGTLFSLKDNGRIEQKHYFDIIDYLKNTTIKLSGKNLFKDAAVLWVDLIKQWQKNLNKGKASLTLTAGLDSRTILGGFINSGYENFDTFTFGHPLSSDVMYAKKFAELFKISHRHVFPDNEFFENFGKYAKEVSASGNSFVSIYRAHRLHAYESIMEDSDAIYLGMGGSDLVRGSGYDRLIVSDIAQHCFLKKSPESYFQQEHIQENLRKKGFCSYESVLETIRQSHYLKHSIHYLFNVIIPLHFNQDVMICNAKNRDIFLPFLDLDYLHFLSGTQYLDFTEYSNFKIRDYKARNRGLYYSANLLKHVHQELSGFTLGKGYSPNDILKYRAAVFVKAYAHKLRQRRKKHIANFSYGKWFYSFINSYFAENQMEDTGLHIEFLSEKLKNMSQNGGEFHFLDHVKAINIHLAAK